MSKKEILFFIILIVFLAAFSIYVLKPQIAGDSLLYTESIEVLKTGIQPPGFIPMMMVSTYLGLRLIMFLDFFIQNIGVSWLLLNGILYVLFGLASFILLKKIFQNSKVAFLGFLLLMTNYAVVAFGLGYLMDMGGWAAYMVAIYFSYLYLERGEDKHLYLAALVIGLGGLYKEYSFVAYVIVLGTLLFKNWHHWRIVFWQTAKTGLLAFGPFFLLNVYGFFVFHYTYIDWFLYNQGAYDYQNRLVEFIKSFGSIYNFGWFLFIPGFFYLLKYSQNAWRNKNWEPQLVFIWLVIFSSFSVLLWPVVTRVLFITMPATILVSCLFMEKIKEKLYLLAPIFILYILAAFLMDAFVLDFVNLPI